MTRETSLNPQLTHQKAHIILSHAGHQSEIRGHPQTAPVQEKSLNNVSNIKSRFKYVSTSSKQIASLLHWYRNKVALDQVVER